MILHVGEDHVSGRNVHPIDSWFFLPVYKTLKSNLISPNICETLRVAREEDRATYHDEVLDVLEPSEFCPVLLKILLGEAPLLLSEPGAVAPVAWWWCSDPLPWLARLDRDQSLTSC